MEKQDNSWDILIILDACRYDYFKQVYEYFFLNAVLTKKKRILTDTEMWVNKMFLNKDSSNIIYITPIVCIDAWLPKHNLFKIVKSWETDWDSNYGIVMPEGTNNSFFRVFKQYADKKYVIHYDQPHTPYVGFMPDEPRTINGTLKRINPSAVKKILFHIWTKINFPEIWLWYANQFLMFFKKSGKELSYFSQVQRSGVSLEDAYIGNLRYVLHYVKEIVQQNPEKKIVITADHGECLGENGKYGHKGKKGKEISDVPWLEIGGRPDVNDKL